MEGIVFVASAMNPASITFPSELFSELEGELTLGFGFYESPKLFQQGIQESPFAVASSIVTAVVQDYNKLKGNVTITMSLLSEV